MSLTDYNYWLTKSPKQIIDEVIKVGGWEKVFAKDFPRFAHRVRNYFNQEPRILRYKDYDESKGYMVKLLNMVITKKLPEHASDPKRVFALTGDTYLDEYSNVWFQMTPAGTVYHFKHNAKMEVKAGEMTVLGQKGTPIFKLVAPDGTGGSRETIIKNYFRKQTRDLGLLGNLTGINVKVSYKAGDERIGNGESVSVVDRIEDDYHYQGSYNYGETAVSGSKAHTRFDVKPHEAEEKDYINPYDDKPLERFSDINGRRFPEKDKKGIVLADQQWEKK